MSISELFVNNYYDLFANSITLRHGGGSTGISPTGPTGPTGGTGPTGPPGGPGADSTFTGTFAGPWSNQTGSVVCTKSRNSINVNFPQIQATATNSSPIGMAIPANLPAAFIPAVSKNFPIIVQNNGTYQTGELQISSGGLVQIYADLNFSNFTNTGACGFPSFSASYGGN